MKKILFFALGSIYSLLSLNQTRVHENNLKEFIKGLPKAELHVHLEGTMEPEQLMLFAERNGVKTPYRTVQEAKDAYSFSDLKSFLDVYIQATEVLRTEQDFYDLTHAYLKKAAEQGVVHTEIFFDLQTYMPRNISPETIIHGVHRALGDARKDWGISGGMIMCFIRHREQEDAFKALELSLPFKDKILGVGLAALEHGHPPSKFKDVFEKARKHGYRVVAHEGECSHTGIPDAIDIINVDRLDHGIHVMNDPKLIQKLANKRTPLTVCPLSNVALNVVNDAQSHPVKKMIKEGLHVSLHSDDPAFFGGYIAENFHIAVKEMGLSLDDIVQCAYNSIDASFATEDRKKAYRAQIDEYIKRFSW